jgi:hypothetical protein
MAIPPKYPPVSERLVSSASRANYLNVAAYSQPYLVTSHDQCTSKTVGRYLPLFPHEPEDARLTGCTRSLYRRVLGLNVTATLGHLQVLSTTNFANSKIA